ncbi:hypothetical protein PHMEG_00016332 [Phytophthora megakarya]|uniref:Uncharacterized protein n=1 Tax=Phytophthora megakarya TaxID=4795 RepID=A0A225VZ92_9STRA|nr:hypothetical protein PHMEG_00016332 [Phytophthora megakarya]
MRNQADIDLENSPAIRVVSEIIEELISDLHSKWSVATQEWHDLKSLPGGEIQQLHRDFQTFETAEAMLEPHAGVSYEEENTRLHCFIRVDGIDQDTNATEAVVWESYRFPCCFKHCISKRDLSNHARACASNFDKERIDKLRKENNDKGGKSAKCQRHFSKKTR